MGCRGFGAILFAEFRCKSLLPSSEFGAAGCVRAGIARVSEDFVGYCIVRFSLLVGWTVRFCGYVGFLPKSFVGFALTAVGSIVLVDNGMEYQNISSLSRTNAFFTIWFCPAYLVKWTCIQRNCHHFAVSGNPKNVQKGYTNSVFFPPIMKNERYKPNKTN